MNKNNITPRAVGQFRLAGTKSFRLACGKFFDFGLNCLLGDTEVLTPAGWQQLNRLPSIVTAMCWDSTTNELSWQQVTTISRPHDGALLGADGWFHQLLYTPDHSITYRPTIHGKWRTDSAIAVLPRDRFQLPIAGKYNGRPSDLTEQQACVIAMLQADGSCKNGSWRISFMKERKKKRILELRPSITLIPQKPSDPAYVRYGVYCNFNTTMWLSGTDKTFSRDLMETPLHVRLAFLQELATWDGTTRGDSWQYFTVNKVNAHFVQTLSHISGLSATIRVNEDNNRGYGQGNNKPLYTVAIKPRDYCDMETTVRFNIPYNGMVYCLNTPTGHFICRRNGVITITHNCQNPAKSAMESMVARPGHSFVQADQSGAEALYVAYESRPGAYRALFLNDIKPHEFLALHIFGRSKPQWFQSLPLSADAYLEAKDPNVLAKLAGWKQLSKIIRASDADADKPYFVGKRTAHGASYSMGPFTFQLAVLKDTHGSMVLTFSQCKEFLGMFGRLFPEVVEWQQEVVHEARVNKVLYNGFGFPRHCGRTFTDGYERELISWKPQSTIGCITTNGILAMREHIKACKIKWNILNNKHDSYLVEVPDEQVKECAIKMVSTLAINLCGRDGIRYTMKAEVQVGKNWAPSYKNNSNLNGMKSFDL